MLFLALSLWELGIAATGNLRAFILYFENEGPLKNRKTSWGHLAKRWWICECIHSKSFTAVEYVYLFYPITIVLLQLS